MSLKYHHVNVMSDSGVDASKGLVITLESLSSGRRRSSD